MALAQRKQDVTEARLAGLSMPRGEAAWATETRMAALARLREMGLPQGRDEYWKFTKPDTLVAAEAPQAALFADDFDAAQSGDLSGTGLEIARLTEAMATDIHWAREVYGTLEAQGQTPVARPLAVLNTAFATDGVMIRASAGVTAAIRFIYLRKSEDSDAILHHCVKIEPGAALTVLETGPSAARFNTVMEAEIGDGGSLHHIHLQGRDHERRAATALFTRLGAESTLKSFTLTFNGAMTRNECVVDLAGAGGIAHVAGACLGDGPDFHHDDTVFITHSAPGCESRQVFKKVLSNGATGVFQGKILVKRAAQKTDGYQISQSLLLGDESQFLAKPELEIYADDVACSHGSTSGAIDEEALFYLRSRGVPEGPATDLLVLAFLAESLQEIEDETIADELIVRLQGWLERHSR